MPQTVGYRTVFALLKELQKLPLIRNSEQLRLVQEEDWAAVEKMLTTYSCGQPLPEGTLEGLGLTEHTERPVSPQRPDWWQPWVGPHAIERYQEHFPQADRNDILWDIIGGVEISAELACTMLCRYKPSSSKDRYIISRERKGIFVLTFDSVDIYQHTTFDTSMVTYIRLSQTGEDFALKEWPIQ